jgi:hypothetical protein
MLISNVAWTRWASVRVAACLFAVVLVSPLASMTPLASTTPLTSMTPLSAPPGQTARVDNHMFDALLQRHVVNGFVDYDAFARAPEFAQYLAALDAVKPDQLDEDERLAFWINVYNAYTIQLIVTHHETESIRNINKTLGVLQLKGPWSEPIVHAAGRALTLDDVHHGILRKLFSEPRVHFALACGAIGCPALRNEAYTGERLLDQFNDQARRFLRESPTKNHIEGRAAFLSPVLTAYRNDFGPAREDLGRAIAPYFEGDTKALFEKGRFFVQETSFDWTLNSLAHGQAKHLLDGAPRTPS